MRRSEVPQERKYSHGYGLRQYAGKPVEDAEKNAEAGDLPELSEGMTLELAGVDLKEGKTSPPKRFTDVIHFESRQWKYSKCKGAG